MERAPKGQGWSPRAGFAVGFGAGLTVVYFIGLFQGLSLGTLLWRSVVGAVVFGAFCALLVYLLGDPFEMYGKEAMEEGAEEGEEEEAQEATEEEEREGGGEAPASGQG